MGNNNCTQIKLPEKSDFTDRYTPIMSSKSQKQLTPLASQNLYECQSPLPFSSKHEGFLQQFSEANIIEVCFNKIFCEERKTPLKIPISNQPKLLSSLDSPTALPSKNSIWNNSVLSYFFKEKEQKKQLSVQNLPQLLQSYSSCINKQRKMQSSHFAIKKQFFYEIKLEPIEDYYFLDKKIGEGSFGSVFKGYCKKTKEVKAIKLLKKKYMTKEDQSKILEEVTLLKKLDHINIIKLDDIFYNNCFYYIVTEFCQGGTLLDALMHSKLNTQAEVSIIMRQILSAVSYLHQLKIAHLDLKLQNIVLVKELNDQNINQCVKIIDFGLAKRCPKFLKNPCKRIGTLSYMAPQIFRNHFSCHSDIWSCGIIMCIMLIGFNPFRKNKQEKTIAAIISSNLDTNSSEWSNISTDAKMIVSGMLKKEPEKRIPLNKLLAERWFQQEKCLLLNRDANNTFLSNVSKYYRDNNFITYIKNYIISKGVSQSERQEMAALFSRLDKDHSGFLEVEQILELYKVVKGTPLTKQIQNQLKSHINMLDQNKSGKIDFQEFLFLMTKIDDIKSDEYLNEAFEYIDRDKTGFIEKEEMIDCLGDEEEVIEMISMIDWNGDGMVSREEFMNYIRGSIQR